VTSPEDTPPLLSAEGVRITIDEVVAMEHLDALTEGDRLVVAGDSLPLMAVLLGAALEGGADLEPLEGPPSIAEVAAGVLKVAGATVADGQHHTVVGAAPLDPALPADWTVGEYLIWSARLAGARSRAAKQHAMAALERVGLGGAGRRKLSSLALAERRVLVLAQASIESPGVVVADAPLCELDPAGAAFVSDALVRVTEGRRAIVSTRRLLPGTAEGDLAQGATDVLVFMHGALAASGTPSEVLSGVSVYGLLVRGETDELREQLRGRGLELRGGPHRFSVACRIARGRGYERHLGLGSRVRRRAARDAAAVLGERRLALSVRGYLEKPRPMGALRHRVPPHKESCRGCDLPALELARQPRASCSEKCVECSASSSTYP